MDTMIVSTAFARSFVAAFIGSILMTTTSCSLQGCTMIGCTNQAAIIIRRTDGRPAPVAVQLHVDSRSITCPAPPVNGTTQCSHPEVYQSHGEVTICVEERQQDTVSCHIQGTTQFEQRITISGTPQQIMVTIQDDVQPVNEHVFLPLYESLHPNGRGCDPVCRQAVERWEIP